jgi:hypothetical protein
VIIQSLATQEMMAVTEGRRYDVYGLAQYADRTITLVRSDDGRPNWCPLDWFRVVDGRMPGGWEFSVVDPTGPALQLLFGYPQLVKDPEHYDGLLERDAQAISIFEEVAAFGSNLRIPSNEEFLSNFGVAPTRREGSSCSSIDLEDPTGRTVRLRWDSVTRSAKWTLFTGDDPLVKEEVSDLVGISVYCENGESGVVLQHGNVAMRSRIEVRVYPTIRVQVEPVER